MCILVQETNLTDFLIGYQVQKPLVSLLLKRR